MIVSFVARVAMMDGLSGRPVGELHSDARREWRAAFDAQARTAVDAHGPGNGDAPLVQGAHGEGRPTGTDDSHQGRGGGARGLARRATATEAPSSPAGALQPDRGRAQRFPATRLGEPRIPQQRVQPHVMEQLADVVPVVQVLDLPVAQGGRGPVQAIKVPKKSKSSRRCFVPEFCFFVPMVQQTAEQLVEVFTTASFSSLQRTVEQSVDIPGAGRRPGGGEGLQSLRPGQDSTAFGGAKHVGTPVPHGRGGGGGLRGLRPGQGSSASSSMNRSYVAEGAFVGFSHFSQSEQKCRVRQPVRRSPAGLFFIGRSRRALESGGLWPWHFAG